ncbi:GRF zinc finger containing protein [Striga asiatica]|uniref:GRF zinc finger containing protein n=1 Tax=Striga asiatica TaxID=4170 RepID=A0A5A7QB44_STRAF|nr:GRF zinc finger containing protein [Striga asiatica]
MFRQISEELIDDFCHCGKPTVRKTSWADGNAGWRYSSGEKYRMSMLDGCTYHVWVDPPICYRAQQLIPGLLKRAKKLEEDIARRKEWETLILFAIIGLIVLCFLKCKEIVLSTIHGQMEREAFPSTRLALLRGPTLNLEEVDPPRFPFRKESPVKHKMQQLNTDNNTSHP